MKKLYWIATCGVLACWSPVVAAEEVAENPVVAEESQFKIAFGSCAHQKHPLPIFNRVVEHKPDLFVFLGDNIYGDTNNMKLLRQKYDMMAAKESYQLLKKNVPIIATWDDHDYGGNDQGKEYRHKEDSKEEFLRFFEEPLDSERRKRAGIYTSYYKKVGEKTIQIILLDNRTFRDRLVKFNASRHGRTHLFYRPEYAPHTDGKSTFLGKEQWAWLDRELKKPADVRIIGTGSQFSHQWNGYESWTNYPHEQAKMVELIKKNQAEGVMFISGDVHYGEISARQYKGCYPLIDVTSSGLSSTWKYATPNRYRIEGPIMENHFGLITVKFGKTTPVITSEIWDIRGNQRVEYTIPLTMLKFPRKGE